jgi:hypothetical protein
MALIELGCLAREGRALHQIQRVFGRRQRKGLTGMTGVQRPDSSGPRVRTWWAAVLAGLVDEPHPNFGADVAVAFKGGTLRLSGELPTEEDRKQLLDEARAYVGHGIDAVDARQLRVIKRREKPGILDQTLIAAFADRDVAEFARRYLLDSRRIKVKHEEILDGKQEGRARRLLPDGFMKEVHKAFDSGGAILILKVDETAAFRVRELLAQETRSLWTVATPPTAASGPES